MGEKHRRPPARTPEEDEKYMISIAVKAAEQKILSGQASSQLLTHYLKLATVREQLEKEKLSKEIELLGAKKEAIESAKHLEELYSEAMKAMGIYTGEAGKDEEEETEEYYD